MKIALVQQKAENDRKDNRIRGLPEVDEAARNGASIISFAELAFERFYPQVKATDKALAFAEPVDGSTVKRFQKKAKQHGVVIVLNIFEQDGEQSGQERRVSRSI